MPEFNAGAMENFGCVVHGEQYYIFRSPVTDYEYENRANTILHEMAHMWFGDLVTMRWWDDLWLNESFAEWASHWCNAQATRFTDAWTTFLSVRKNWGYRQDQLSSTHPVYCDMPDMEAVEVNFDGITYAKGASVIKQLVAYVGIDSFVAGLRDYFGKHAWGNATFDDLLTSLEAASGRELREFAAQWLETAQVNTLRPVVTLAADGTYASVVVQQEAPADYPTLRTHRIGVGLYDLADGVLVRRETGRGDRVGRAHRADRAGRRAGGRRAAAQRRRPDLREDCGSTSARWRSSWTTSATSTTRWPAPVPGRPRGTWSATPSCPPATTWRWSATACRAETDINLVTATLRQARTALTSYADPAWAPTGCNSSPRRRGRRWRRRRRAAASSWPGRARSSARAAARRRSTALAGWLDGDGVPDGLTIDTELRWSILQALAANGAAGEAEIAAELDNDRTASGERQAAIATALIPTPEAKAETWRRLTERRGAAQLAAAGAADRLPALGAGRADRAVRGPLLRGRRRDLGHPGQRAGAGVRRGRVPGPAGQCRHRARDRRVARGARQAGGAAPAGRRGPRRRRAGAGRPG